MVIQVNSSYRVRSTKDCWQIEQLQSFKDKEGNDIWHTKGYYTNPENALRELFHLQVRMIDGGDTKKILSEIAKIRKEIFEAFKGFGYEKAKSKA